MKKLKTFFYILIFITASFLFYQNIFMEKTPEFPFAKEDTDFNQNFKLFRYKNFWNKGNDAVFAFNDNNNVLRLYKFENNSLKLKGSIKLKSALHALATYKEKDKEYILIALGYSRTNLSAPISLYLYDKNLKNEKLLFYKDNSPRSQITFLKQIGDDIYINYFNSKYYTTLTRVFRAQNVAWSYEEILTKRLGINVDVYNQNILFARPYKDEENNESEIILVNKEKETINLPSHRGARAGIIIKNKNKKDYPDILVADGWHQYYSKYAKSYLSLIEYDNEKEKYNLKQISFLDGQISIEKIIPFKIKDNSFVLTRGAKFIDIFDIKNNWKRKRIFEKQGDILTNFDAIFAMLENKPRIIIFDKEILIKDL